MLRQIKAHYNFRKDGEFAEFLGIKSNTLSTWKSRNTFDAERIFSKCNEISAEWLLTGRGEMVTQTKEKSITSYSSGDKSLSHQLIPLYNVEATAGLVNLFDSTQRQEVVDTIKIPNLPKCDGAVFVSGDSMYPLLKSGDIIAYKQIMNFWENVFYGEMYLLSIDLEGEEYVTVKFIQKSEEGPEYIRLVSQNQHHAPKDVRLEKVRAMAMIKASIRMNTMN